MNNILSGLRVIEISAFVAAPSAGMTLAQMGAEVIRVDMIGGGPDIRRWPVAKGSGQSLYWAGLNKAKKSVCLNLRSSEGREILNKLIAAPGANGGIFISNLPLKNTLDLTALRARRPDVIGVLITGSRSGRTAVDYTVNAFAGFPTATGSPEQATPINNPLPAWDLLTGQSAVIALLVAERHRNATGKGQLVTLALEDIALANTAHLGMIGEVQINGTSRLRLGNHLYGSFGHDFVTQDGIRLMIVAVSTKQWRAIVTATSLQDRFAVLAKEFGLDFDKEEDRFEARDAIVDLLNDWTFARPFHQVAEQLTAHRACWAPYRTFAEVGSSDLGSNPLFAKIEQPGIGSYPMPGSCFDFEASPRRHTLPAPVLGCDTRLVLANVLGMSADELDALQARGILPAAPVRARELESAR
jgi:2-methylfumaryl-CoA isomerase